MLLADSHSNSCVAFQTEYYENSQVYLLCPDRREGRNKRCFCPSVRPSVRPSCTSRIIREPKGLACPNLEWSFPTVDATRVPVSRSNGQRSGLEAGGGIPCRPNPAATLLVSNVCCIVFGISAFYCWSVTASWRWWCFHCGVSVLHLIAFSYNTAVVSNSPDKTTLCLKNPDPCNQYDITSPIYNIY